MPARKNLVGCVFGRWEVLSYGGPGAVGATWLCRCDCGNERAVNASSLLAGTSASCGCVGLQKFVQRATKHGHNRRTTTGRSTTYDTWAGMLRRCKDERHPSYRNYGGKGVTVCDGWKSFGVFLSDMGERPEGKTLDRIDNNKGYSKDNCRWMTMLEQGNNRANNHHLTHNGETHTIAEWSRILGIKVGTIRARVCRGLSDEDALKPT